MSRTLLGILLAASIALSTVGVGLVPEMLPQTTRAYSARYSLSEDAGISPADMARVASDIHGFTVFGRPSQLPETVAGRPGFDAEAVSHLVDVRIVIWKAAAALAVALALAASCAYVLWRRRDYKALTCAFVAGGVLPLVLFGAGALWATADFDAFFAFFHSLFFSAGTWQFAADDLLILCLPEPFWVAMGVLWASCTTAIALLVVASGVVLHRFGRRAQHGQITPRA